MFPLLTIMFMITCLAITFSMNTWMVLSYTAFWTQNMSVQITFLVISPGLFPWGIGPRLKVMNDFTGQMRSTFSETAVVSSYDFLSPGCFINDERIRKNFSGGNYPTVVSYPWPLLKTHWHFTQIHWALGPAEISHRWVWPIYPERKCFPGGSCPFC